MEPASHPSHHPRALTHIRGASLLLLRRSFRSGMTPAQWERMLNEVTEATSAFLRTDPDPQAWVPLTVIEDARRAFKRQAGADPAPVRGGMMASHILAFGQSLGFFQAQSPEGVLRDYPQVWLELHQGGQAIFEALGPGAASLVIRAEFPYPDYPEGFLPACFQKLVQLAGGRLVKVQHQAVPAPGFGYRYQLSWR